MKACDGHECELTTLYRRDRGKGYERIPNVMICVKCIEAGCFCFGIHPLHEDVPKVPVDFAPERNVRMIR